MKTRGIYIKQGGYFLLLFFILSFSFCQVVDPIEHINNTDFQARESFLYDISIYNQKLIEVEGINGQISIVGEAGRSTIKICGERIVESDSYDDAETHLKYLKVQIVEKSDKIYIETEQPTTTYGRNYQVNYHITIPVNWDVDIENVNGKVEIDSLKGDVGVQLVNGDIVLKEIVGNVLVAVTNGTIYGKICVPFNGLCKIEAVNGQIQLNIPTTTSAEFDAKVTNGTINVSNLVLKNMVTSRNVVSGSLGGGEGSVHLQTVKGTISVNGF